MPARRRPATARVTEPVEPGLRLHAEGERYSTLLRERERLLRSIRTKKQKLERALEDSHEARRAVLERLIIGFRDGKISLRQFILGPVLQHSDEDIEAARFDALGGEPARAAKRAKRRK